jgi:hypothetical protein
MRDQPRKVRRPASEWFKCGEDCFQLWQRLQVWRWEQPSIVVLLPLNMMRTPPKWRGQPPIVKRHCLQYWWGQIPIVMRVSFRSEDIGLQVGALTLVMSMWQLYPKLDGLSVPPRHNDPKKTLYFFAPNSLWHDSTSKISLSSNLSKNFRLWAFILLFRTVKKLSCVVWLGF